ncbi:MAG: hypothetical protein LBS18_01750 [Clostridiales bacterium]|jgi:hypothetical protein|nr:hypothetical protein [Clostridiales bacterium]
MLLTFDETIKKISGGGLLHIAATEELLKKLPKGNWIGGSTEYFMSQEGGKITGELLFVTDFPYDTFKIESYDETSISNVTVDAFDSGFSIVILPFDSAVHKAYADKASEFEEMFVKNVAGWVSGINLGAAGQTPVSANGQTGEIFSNKSVVAHICVPDDKMVSIGIVNIFSQDEDSPVIEFTEEGFLAKTCRVDGEEVSFADYIEKNGIDTKLPLIGDYSGVGVNVSFKAIENGVVNFYAPVFPGIKYKMANTITDYVKEFNDHLKNIQDVKAVFSCNCILNFLYGELEGKDIDAFFGPITFGEVAYQLVNQTLVYVTVS